MRTRRIDPRLVLVALALLFSGAARALPPSMKIVVPFPAGGNGDPVARAIAPVLAKRLGIAVFVENTPEGAGVVGANSVAKTARDGSTLLLVTSNFLTTAASLPRLPYDPLTGFTPVALVAEGSLLLAASTQSGIRSSADLIREARARPAAVRYGTFGAGSVTHVGMEWFGSATQTRMTHVPFSGGPAAGAALARGDIDVLLSPFSALQTEIKAGTVLPLAVTSRSPNPAYPSLPALSASVPGFAVEGWIGVFAPAGTPPALVKRLNHEIRAIAASDVLRPLLEQNGAVAVSSTPEAIAARLRGEYTLWQRIVAERKLSAE